MRAQFGESDRLKIPPVKTASSRVHFVSPAKTHGAEEQQAHLGRSWDERAISGKAILHNSTTGD